MTSPYLDRPLLPPARARHRRRLALALPWMLEKIETELANEKLETAEKCRLRLRAGLIRALLTPSPIA
jgi:hypothetical protein